MSEPEQPLVGPLATPARVSTGPTSGWLRLVAGLLLAVQLVVLYLPGSPDGGLELPWLPGADKVIHGLVFAIPVYLFGRLTGRVGLVAGLFGVHAVLSELIQWRFVPYRDGDVWDALADLAGIAIAVLLLRRNQTSGR
ncbi:MAG: VanZ family protein [Propionibacteriaceae bacterium]|nr:VanZ family protein [Propionibacteriaceae bacterium]